MTSLLSNGSDDYFENNMKDIIINNITKGINNKDKSESRYVVDYIVSANVAVIKKWLRDDNEIEPREIALLISWFTINGPSNNQVISKNRVSKNREI